jgi:gliding motility-associated-like protein
MKHFLFKRAGSLMLLLGFLLCSIQSWSQYTVTNLETGKQYTALTKDNSNNVYGVRLNFTTNKGEVVKFAAGSSTPTVIYNNLVFEAGMAQIYPWGIAVNNNGDVFVTSANQPVGWEIIKLTAPSYAASIIQTGRYFSALAVDQSNNLLAMEYNPSTVRYRLMRYPAGAESAMGTQVWAGVNYPGGSVTYPYSIALDPLNNIYVLDFWENGGGQLYKLTAPTYTTATVISGGKSFSGLAIDGSNNIYTIEGTSPTAAQVMKYAGGNMAAGTTLYSGLTNAIAFYAWGLAVTGDGKIFVGDAPAVPSGRLVQLAPPNITVSSVNRVGAASTNTTTTVQYTVTFSASASNVTTSSFALTTTGGITGASIAGVSGSGTTYTVTVNVGTGEGTIRLDVNGTGITPAVSNVPFTTGQVYTIDRTAPNTTITTNPPPVTNNASASFTFTSTETGAFEASIDGGAYTAATSPKTYTGLADGPHTLNVRAIDAAGNVDASPATYTWTVDATPPNTTILTTPPILSTSSSATFTFDASESGSTFQGQLDAGAYVTITSPITYNALAEGSHTFSVRAVDAAGNIDATPATYTWTVDAVPTVTSVSVPANGYYNAGQSLSFAVNFNENVTVTGAPSLPLTIGSSTVQANYVSGSGTSVLTFAYMIQAGDNDMDGITIGAALQLNGGAIKDASNNATLTLNSVGNTSNVFVNTVIPTVVLTTTAPAVVNAPFTVTITFSEAVTGFTVGDFSVSGAGLSGLFTTDNITYTVQATPLSDGIVTIQVPANKAANIGNNGNSASNTLSLTYDATAPAVSSVNVPAAGYYNAGATLNFTVNFNENVTVNTTGGNPQLTLTIGSTLVNATYTGGTATSLSFAYTVAAGDHDMDGITVGNLVLNGSTIKDAAGNNANLTLNSVGNTSLVRVNTTTPTVTISSNATNPVTGPFTLTITFSEAVTGFIASDISVTNATLSALSTSDNITYTATVTPTAGAISINVPANAAENIGRNGNSASNTLSLVFDTTPPTITSVSVPANGYYKAGDALNFTVTFDENIAVAGGTPSLEVVIGSTTVQATQVAAAANTILFRYTVVSGNTDMDGITIGTLKPNGSTIKDIAGNNANITLNNVGNTSGVFVNTSIPWVVIGGAVKLNAPWTANIVFGEVVTGFDISDIQLTNATVSNFQTTDNITYTVLITPLAQGTVSVSVPANAAVNIGGNGNTASAPLTWQYDPNPPVITSVTVPANGYYKAGDVLNFIVNFNENVLVTGAPTLPVVIGSTTVQASFVSGNNSSALAFSYTVVDGDLDMNGISFGADLQLGSAAIKDVATNNATTTLQNIGNTSGVFVNTTHATVTLSTTATRVNAAFTVTVTFSEAVTGLTPTDFTTTNATVGTPQTTDNITYTVVVTPVADGSVSISLPADAAMNVANNGTKASNTVTVTRDATAPVITASQNFNILQNSTAGTPIGQVAATDASSILQNYTITSDPTGGAFQISATGLISVKDMAILNTNVGSTSNVLITVSDGLNTSAATAVAIKIDAINKAPVLDAVNNIVHCATTHSQTIQLTGASAIEPTQTYTLSIASNQALFDVLTVNAAGLITYQLKASAASGVATITVTIKDNGGTANGGVDTYQRTFTITVNPLPVITITSDKGNSVSKGEIVHLTATGAATYNWTATTSSIISGAHTAVAEVRPQTNTTYQVTAATNLGCNSTASYSIATIEDFKVDATNVLTPNGDGKNDRWVIRNIDSYPDNELKIFDRSGRMVFSQRNYNNTWDGKVNGHPLAEGTYYYFLTISGGAKTAKGFITIIRKAN